MLAVKSKKCWGVTECVYESASMEIHNLTIKANTWCSKHFHRNKVNIFHLLSGEVDVVVYLEKIGKVRISKLTESDPRLVVLCNIWHRFIGIKDSQLIEIYETRNIVPDDIEREDEGSSGEIRKELYGLQS